ncbi:MAG TPA: branched-chain amino acid ABC transporter permease [Ktedonobacteraceae bacterium]|nr:branched-chain amino acid ABC transporter permease [Ktedonobacteraceae bacterium]
MSFIIQGVVLGILTGGIYALMASGLTLIFGVLEIINVAQGILVVLGAYLSFVLERSLHIDLFLGLFITLPLMFGLGVLLEWAFIRRLKWERITLSILATYAIALIIEGVLGYIFTTNFQEMHSWYIDDAFNFNGFYINYVYIFTFLLSVVLLAALFLLVYRTDFGRKLRASMQNRTAASLIGINVSQIQAITYGIGTALAAAGGMAFGATNAFNPASSYDLIYRLLVIIVLGGLGSLRGALIGSLAMVIIGDVVALLWSPVWSSTVFFVLLAILLVFRPQGLFGRLEGRKQ